MATGVGIRIRDRRRQLRLSQTDLAERLNLKSKSTVCKVERGDDNLTADTIQKYADALNTSPAYLMGWTDNPDPLYVLTEEYEIEEYDQMMHEALDKIAHIQAKEQINQREMLNKAISLYEKYKNAPVDIQSAIETLLKSVQQEP